MSDSKKDRKIQSNDNYSMFEEHRRARIREICLATISLEVDSFQLRNAAPHPKPWHLPEITPSNTTPSSTTNSHTLK